MRRDKKKIITISRTVSLRFLTISWCSAEFSQVKMRISSETENSAMRRFVDILYVVIAISRALRSWAQEGVFREEERGVQFAGNR